MALDESEVAAAVADLPDTTLRDLAPDALVAARATLPVTKPKLGGRPSLTPTQIRHRAVLVATLLTDGHSFSSAAKQLKVTRQTIHRWFVQAQQLQLLEKGSVQRTADRIDTECLPLAIDSLTHHLLARDKDTTIRTLEGRGVFVSHQAVKSSGGGSLPSLKVIVETGADSSVSVLGQVVGAGAALPAATEP